MPLTHVCMWSEHGWISITADEAARLHPGGTVSARSGLFMCELCGQYVTLTDGNIRDRYYKHSAEEKSKDCPERSFAVTTTTSFQAGAHTLPIRLNWLSAERFDIQIGLLPVPDGLIENHLSEKLTIESSGWGHSCYQYLLSRLNPENITYISVGGTPCSKYRLIPPKTVVGIEGYWPLQIDGISPQGALFDPVGGKMLPEDADTQINHKYYLLVPYTLPSKKQSIDISLKCKTGSIPRWYVYEVCAKAFDESAARFFLDYRCRLTESIVSFLQIWPNCMRTPYFIRQNAEELYFLLRGEATSKVFPETLLRTFALDNVEKAHVLFINSHERQQLLSAGRTKVLRYTYLLKDSLDQVTSLPDITITDKHGNRIEPGEQESMPIEKTICIHSEFDGIVCVRLHGTVIEQIGLKADSLIEVVIPSWGTEIAVTQGLDCVWEARFARKAKKKLVDGDYLYEQLIRCGDPTIPISHSVGSALKRMSTSPKVKRWLNKCIREGEISYKAYRKLQDLISSQ